MHSCEEAQSSPCIRALCSLCSSLSALTRPMFERLSELPNSEPTAVKETAQSISTNPIETSFSVQVSGIHWWYKTASHAAELCAGFYNPHNRDGYAPIADMLARHDAAFNFTCVELITTAQEDSFPEAMADPEGLVWQVSDFFPCMNGSSARATGPSSGRDSSSS